MKDKPINESTARLARCALAASLALSALAALPAVAGPVEDLHQLFDEAWERTLEENPTDASTLGDRRYNTLWPDVSLAAIEKSHAADVELLERIGRIDANALPAEERVNYEIFKRQYRNRVEGYAFRRFLMPVNQRGGIQTEDELVESLRFETVRDYEDWIARLDSIGGYVDQTIALMRAGMAEKRVQPRKVMERVPGQIAAQLVSTPDASPFYKPFREFADSVPEAERERLARAAQAAITRSVLPAYERFQNSSTTNTCPPAARASARPSCRTAALSTHGSRATTRRSISRPMRSTSSGRRKSHAYAARWRRSSRRSASRGRSSSSSSICGPTRSSTTRTRRSSSRRISRRRSASIRSS
jgi:uncharacterized protein (DUF885 family)